MNCGSAAIAAGPLADHGSSPPRLIRSSVPEIPVEIIAQLAPIPGMSARQEDEVVRKLWDGDPRIAILAEGKR